MFFVCISEECKDQGKQVKNSIPSTKGKEELKLLISHFEDYFWQYTQFTGVPVYVCLYNFAVFITFDISSLHNKCELCSSSYEKDNAITK